MSGYFVGRRLNEDLALPQRLARSTGPDGILTAFPDFWGEAVEDYGKRAPHDDEDDDQTTSKMAVTAQSATEEAHTRLFSQEAA
jgi:hypothetical protein